MLLLFTALASAPRAAAPWQVSDSLAVAGKAMLAQLLRMCNS